MKILQSIVGITVASLLLSACQEGNPEITMPSRDDVLQAQTERGQKNNLDFSVFAQLDRFALEQNQDAIDLNAIQEILIEARKKEAEEEFQAVQSIFHSLMSSEAKAETLKVGFSMSDDPVEDGIFIFQVESPIKGSLSLQLYDEEGFQLAAENEIHIEKGANYKALNVKALDTGEYLFRLRNSFGEELMRRIEIKQN